MRPFIGHYELEMDAEELPAEQAVILGLDDLAESDRYDGGIAAPGTCVDAMRGKRIELEEVHHVLARLAVDPVDRGLDREQAQMIAEALRCLVKADDREIAADRQQHHARAVPAQRRIDLQGAGHDLGSQERPRTVPD